MGLDKSFEAILEAFSLALVAAAALCPFFGAPRLVTRLLISGCLLCLATVLMVTVTTIVPGDELQVDPNLAARFGIRVLVYLFAMLSFCCILIYPLMLRGKPRRRLGQWGLTDTLLSMTSAGMLMGLGLWVANSFARLDHPRIWHSGMAAWGYHGLAPLQIAAIYFVLTLAVVFAAKVRSSGAMLAVVLLAPFVATLMTYLPILIGAEYDPELFFLDRWDMALTVVQPLAFTAVLNLICQANQSKRFRPKHFLRSKVKRDHSHVRFLTDQYSLRKGEKRTQQPG